VPEGGEDEAGGSNHIVAVEAEVARRIRSEAGKSDEEDFLAEAFGSSADSRLPADLLFFGLGSVNCVVVTLDKGMEGIVMASFVAEETPVIASTMSMSAVSVKEFSIGDTEAGGTFS